MWFSGVFANTKALTPTLCILAKTSGLSGCCYIPFSLIDAPSFHWCDKRKWAFDIQLKQLLRILCAFSRKIAPVLKCKNVCCSLALNLCLDQGRRSCPMDIVIPKKIAGTIGLRRQGVTTNHMPKFQVATMSLEVA